MPYCPECSASIPDQTTDCPTCGASLVTTPSVAERGDVSGFPDLESIQPELETSLSPQYEVLRPLGVGGMGAVFLAREPALKRLVAVKVLDPRLAADESARARFEREATAAAALSHPNVVRVYSVGETAVARWPYIVMQYVDGPTLADWMVGQDKVPERDARRIIGEVAAALAAAHQRGVVHRDVKPSNVLLEQDSGRAYVADFGVAAALSMDQHVQQAKLTATGMVIGTPVYMSPEQGAGEGVSTAGDVYSLGMLAYEMVTGELPFRATSALGWVAAHMRDVPTPVSTHRPDLAPEVLQLIDRCLAKDHRHRPTADEIARGMIPRLESEIDWPPPGLGTIHRSASQVVRRLAIAAGGALVLITGIANTPQILRPGVGWLDRFEPAPVTTGEEFRLRPETFDTGSVTYFSWQAIVFVGGAVLVLGLLVTTSRLGELSYQIARVRRLGWRWSTIGDVTVDHDGQTGLLMSGGREYASLGEGSRDQILKVRRYRAIAYLSGMAWPVIVASSWVILVLVGGVTGAASSPVIPRILVSLAVFPAAIALVLGVRYQLHERRLAGPRTRRWNAQTEERDVDDWYANLPAESAGRDQMVRHGVPWGRHVVAALGLIVTVVALLAVAEIIVSSVMAARFVQRMGPLTTGYMTHLDEIADADRLESFHRTMDRYRLPDLATLDDTTSIRLIRRLTGVYRDQEPLPPYDPSLGSASDLRDTVLQIFESGGPLPEDIRKRVAAFDAHPRSAVFRRLSGVSTWALDNAALDRPMEEYQSVMRVPTIRFAPLRAGSQINAAVALAAEMRGDTDEAMHRLGENIEIGQRLIDGRIWLANFVGGWLLRSDALAQVAAIEESRREFARGATARDVSSYLGMALQTVRGGEALLIDASDPSLFRRAMAAPAGVGHGRRYQIVFDSWLGMCGSAWELLTGPSLARLDTVLSIVADPEDPIVSGLARHMHTDLREPWRAEGRPRPWYAFAQWSPALWVTRSNICSAF